MKPFFPNTEELWTVRIQYKGKAYLTLCEGWDSDSLLHSDSNILYFLTVEDMENFCETYGFAWIGRFGITILTHPSQIRSITAEFLTIGIF